MAEAGINAETNKKLGMSLDDLIKQQRTQQRRQQEGGNQDNRAGRGRGGPGRGNFQGRNSQGRGFRDQDFQQNSNMNGPNARNGNNNFHFNQGFEPHEGPGRFGNPRPQVHMPGRGFGPGRGGDGRGRGMASGMIFVPGQGFIQGVKGIPMGAPIALPPNFRLPGMSRNSEGPPQTGYKGMPFPPGMNLAEPMLAQDFQLNGGGGSRLNTDAEPFFPTEGPQFDQPNKPIAVPQARLEATSGEVRVSFRKQDFIKIAKDGSITVDTKGIRGPAIFMALNAVLKVVDVSITRPKNAKPEDGWNVSDGRSLSRFRDGMVIPARGYASAQRGKKVLEAFGGADPTAAAAATAASDAAARAAGIGVNRGRLNDAQSPGENNTQGFGKPHRGSLRGLHPDQDHHFGNEESPGSGGKADQDRVRRLMAKGRFKPY